MAKVTREDIDQNNVRLTLHITPDDYQEAYQKELAKFRKEANLKGFRKGKTPMGVVRKMFGRNVLAKIINETLEEELRVYLDEFDGEYLAEPLPVSDEKLDIDPSGKREYTLEFDMGIVPPYTISGVDEDSTYHIYKVNIPQEDITKELEDLRRRAGKTEPADTIEARDTFTVSLREIDAEGNENEEGVQVEEVMLFTENIDESVRGEFIGANVGDTIDVDVRSLEDTPTDDYLRKYILQIDPDQPFGERYRATVTKVNRLVPAELNEEFYNQVFGEGQVATPEAAEDAIRMNREAGYDARADVLVFDTMSKEILDNTDIQLPKEFMQRWLQFTNDDLSAEQAAAEYEKMTRGLKWSLIKSHLMQRYDIEVTAEDIQQAIARDVIHQFGNQPWMTNEFVSSMVQRMLQNQQQVQDKYEELASNRLMEELKERVTLVENEIGAEELEKLFDEWKAEREGSLEEE